MTVTNGYPQLVEVVADADVYAVAFTANGEHIVSGNSKAVQVWRAKDGKHVATMPVEVTIYCVATSRNGRWIAGGEYGGEVIVWDAMTYQRLFASGGVKIYIWDIEFSPDSSRLISAGDGTVIIWDIATRQQAQTLVHQSVAAAKYSSQGDRIATAAPDSVRVWDSSDGRLLVNLYFSTKAWRGLLWYNNHLFVRTKDGKFREIDASTGSTVSEWAVPDPDPYVCITLPQHGKFIAGRVHETIAFWDTATHTQLSPIQHTCHIYSVACSLDGQLLAFSAGTQICVKDLSSIITQLLPELQIESAVLNAWKHGQLTKAEALLSVAMPASKHTAHHVLASRALVRTRLGHWDAALADAEESLKTRSSAIGYIAKFVTLVRKGEKESGWRVCDSASLRFPSHRVSLLLIKAVVLFMTGKDVDAISRIDDLIADAPAYEELLYVVQAYMRLLLGSKYMESNNHECAIQSFEDARNKLGNRTRQPPLIVSLISGWRFDQLGIIIQQRLAEVLLAANRMKEASECVLPGVDQDVNVFDPIKARVSGEMFYREDE